MPLWNLDACGITNTWGLGPAVGGGELGDAALPSAVPGTSFALYQWQRPGNWKSYRMLLCVQALTIPGSPLLSACDDRIVEQRG
jgi:hypothetical protein